MTTNHDLGWIDDLLDPPEDPDLKDAAILEVSMQESDLNRFVGTERYYRHPSQQLVYTDGVRYVAREGKAYWLIDAIASYQPSPKVTQDPMLREIQFWRLKVNPDSSAVLSCERDTDDIAFAQDIEYTDFPLSEVRFYLTQGVLMLPSEY